LVLVGAVALALIIVSGAVVVNSVLYTGNVSPSGSTGSVDDALSTRESVRQDMSGLLANLSDGDPYVEETTLSNRVDQYAVERERSTAIDSPASVVVGYDPADSVDGTLKRTTNPAKFNSISGGSGKDVVNNADRFVGLRLEVTNVKSPNQDTKGGFVFTFEEDSGSDVWKLYFVAKNFKTGTDRFSVYTKTDGNNAVVLSGCQNVDAGSGEFDEITSTQPVVFSQQGDRLFINWAGGSCQASTAFTTDIDPSFDVTLNILKGGSYPSNLPSGSYNNALKTEANVEFATDGSPGNFPGGDTDTDVVFSAAFDYNYTSPSIDYDGSIQDVEVPSTATLYSASFEPSTSLNDYGLIENAGADAGVDSSIGSPSGAMYLRDGIVEMTDSVDTSSFDQVKVTFWVQEGDSSDGPEAPSNDTGESLNVSFNDPSSSWREYNTFTATDEDGPDTARRVVFYLDGDALHSDFKLRFRQSAADASNDEWYIDEITIEGVD
jgi:hypothetical protein